MAADPREALAAAQDDLTGVTAVDGGWTGSSIWCLLMKVTVIDGMVDAHNLLVAAIGGRR